MTTRATKQSGRAPLRTASNGAPQPKDSRRWRPWLAFPPLVAILVLWSLSSPLFSAPDEPSHVTKAAGAARGQLVGPVRTGEGADDPCVPGVAAPPSGPVTCTHYRVPAIFLQGHQVPGCYNFDRTVTADCAPPYAGSKDEELVPSTAGNYPPLYYLVTGLPSLLSSSVVGVYLMRLMGSLLCVALLGLAVTSVSKLPDRVGAAIGVLLALSPMTLFVSSVVNPSGMEICAAVALWAGGLEALSVDGRARRWALVRTVIGAAALAAARPISPLWVVLIGVSLLLAARRHQLAAAARSQGAGLAALAIAAVTGAGAVWYLVAAPNAGSLGAGVPLSLSRVDILRASLSVSHHRAHQMIGWLGWLDTPVPTVTVAVWAAAVGLLVLAALVFGSWRQRLGIAWLAGLVVLVPPLIESQQAHRVGFFWQGRYLLPLAVGLPIVAGHIGLPALLRRVGAAGVVIRFTLVMAIAVGQVAAFAGTLERYSVRDGGSLFGRVVWSPPILSPAACVVLYAAALLALGWALRPLLTAPAPAPSAAVQARQRSGRPPL